MKPAYRRFWHRSLLSIRSAPGAVAPPWFDSPIDPALVLSISLASL